MREWIGNLDEIDRDCVHRYEYLLGRKLIGYDEYSEIDKQVDEMILEWDSRKAFFKNYPELERYKDGSQKVLDATSKKEVRPFKVATGRQWFLEVVQDFDGSYYANMMLRSKRVEGLPREVRYNELRDAILQKTGIMILDRKDMLFQRLGKKKYAYIDATQDRDDCRVSLDEVQSGWRPKIESGLSSDFFKKPIYIYPHASHACNLDSCCVMVGTVSAYKSAFFSEVAGYRATIDIRIREELYPDGSREKVNRLVRFYDSPDLYERSLAAALEKADDVYRKVETIKALPRIMPPEGSYGSDYFAAMNFEAFSDQDLRVARSLAEEFVGPQSVACSLIKKEMAKRFDQGKMQPGALRPDLDAQIKYADIVKTLVDQGGHASVYFGHNRGER